MFSLQTINAMADRAAVKARRNKRAPYVAKCDGDDGVFKMPNFGTYRNPRWELIQEFFVDSSGFGSDYEPALTVKRFLSKVRTGQGYAVIEQGQFQVVIGEFKKSAVKNKTKKPDFAP